MSILSVVKRHPLRVFLGLSVILGWVLTLLSAQLPVNAALLPLIAIPVSYVPAVLALVMLRLAGTTAERVAFRQRMTTVNVGWKWWAAAIGVGPLIHLTGVALATPLGGEFPAHPAMLALLPLFLITNLGEEIGWRGYALPKLQERFGALTAALILGLVWAVFHWVALMGNPETPLGYVAVSTAHLIALSVIMSYVFNSARQSVLVVAMLHAVYDTVSIGVVPLIETGIPLTAFAMTAVVAWVVAIGVVAASRLSLGHRPRPQAAALVALLLVTGGVLGCDVAATVGSGEVTSEARTVDGFDRIEVSRGMTVDVRMGDAEPIVVSTHANLMSVITSEVDGGVLKLAANREFTAEPAPAVTIVVPSLVGLTVSGGSQVTVHELAADRFEADISGGSTVTVTGNAREVSLVLGGGARALFADLVADIVSMDLNGNSNATVHAETAVSGAANGGSRATVHGGADIRVATTGDSVVTSD